MNLQGFTLNQNIFRFIFSITHCINQSIILIQRYFLNRYLLLLLCLYFCYRCIAIDFNKVLFVLFVLMILLIFRFDVSLHSAPEEKVILFQFGWQFMNGFNQRSPFYQFIWRGVLYGFADRWWPTFLLIGIGHEGVLFGKHWGWTCSAWMVAGTIQRCK